jgi:fructose-specific phosphotransferase system component IIB
MEQLRDLELYVENEQKSGMKNYVQQYSYDQAGIQMVAISIQVPSERIDETAVKLNLKCPISNLESQMSLMYPFKSPVENSEEQ